MAIPKNWLEELVSEFMSINGYSPITNVPLGSHESGGRYEADIIGAKIFNGKIVYIHAECQVALVETHERSRDSILKKFNEEREEEIKALLQGVYQGIEINGGVFLFFSVNIPEKWMQDLKKELDKNKISLITFTELVSCITEAVREAAENRKKRGSNKTDAQHGLVSASIPDGLWLLKLIQTLDDKNLLNLNDTSDSVMNCGSTIL